MLHDALALAPTQLQQAVEDQPATQASDGVPTQRLPLSTCLSKFVFQITLKPTCIPGLLIRRRAVIETKCIVTPLSKKSSPSGCKYHRGYTQAVSPLPKKPGALNRGKELAQLFSDQRPRESKAGESGNVWVRGPGIGIPCSH